MMLLFQSPVPENATYSNEPTSRSTSASPRRTKSKSEFPVKLYAMLELADNIPEFAQAITWLPHGRAFRVLDKAKFMKEVIPVFFNQTKIRSFNRQLHLWGFHRIGRCNQQVWYHDNFLRGVPESMERLVRTKIKGNTVDSSYDGKVPNFDDMPRLPICNKQPSAVLDEMGKAVLKMQSSFIAHRSVKMNPTLLTSSNDADHRTIAPGFESPCEFSLSFNSEEPFVLSPSLLPTSNASQSVPFMHLQLPLQVDTSESMAYTNQASFEGTSRSHQVESHMHRTNSDTACFNPLKQINEDFEPLSFWDYNDCDLSDDFANFIEDAIHQVG